MHQPGPQPECRETSEAPSWGELEALCEALLCLSQQVAGALQQGAGAPALVPLLRQEADLARRLQEGIARPACPDARAGECRQRLAGRLRALLELEQANCGLLRRRGIRIRGPRALPPRSATCL